MASLSDHLLLVAILAYLAAMMCHTAEFSLRPAPRRVDPAPPPVLAAWIGSRVSVAVAVGRPSLTSPETAARRADADIATADRDPARVVSAVSPAREP